MQENNWLITTKKGQGKIPLFCGNGEQVIPIYGGKYVIRVWIGWKLWWLTVIRGGMEEWMEIWGRGWLNREVLYFW